MTELTKTISVLLADDHEVMRDGLKALIAREPDMDVVETVGTGRAAVQVAQELKPDVVLMDISMPDLNGIDATRQIRNELRSVKVLCLSMHLEQSMVGSIQRAGGSGYLVKTCAGPELVRAIRAVASGETYISPSIAGGVIDEYLHGSSGQSEGVFAAISEREREVLQLIAEGNNTKTVAAELGISDKTVAAHRLKLMEKLDCQSVADLTRYAIRQGLVTP